MPEVTQPGRRIVMIPTELLHEVLLASTPASLLMLLSG
jgi:hypothetical protein